MIAKGTAAALVGVALLGGCAQSPAYVPAYYQPVPLAVSAAAMRAFIEQRNAWARPYQPDDAPVAQAAPRPFNVHPAALNNDGAMLSDDPPALPKPPADSDCVGWWRICHFF
jgi:hypothetical protein